MKKYLAFIILFSCFILANAQDPIFDMSYQNRLLMNPAFCGNDGGGKYRINCFNHNYFIDNRGTFRFTSASIDYGLCRTPLSFGLIFQNETQGDGFLTTNTGSFIFGVGPIHLSRDIIFTGALQGNYLDYKVDWSQFVYSDQLDPILGIVQQSSNNFNILNQKTFGTTSGFNFTGIVHYRRSNKKLVWNFGCALNHYIKSPSFALLNNTDSLPIRLTLHGGLFFGSTEITGRLDIQSIYHTEIINIEYYLVKEFSFGLGFRTSAGVPDSYKNSYRPMLEMRIIPPDKGIKILLCYGYDISKNSNGLGSAIEMGIVFIPIGKYCNPLEVLKFKKELKCPPPFEKDKIQPPVPTF
jgi:Type IX secretion system membrane protein PorP/SprF